MTVSKNQKFFIKQYIINNDNSFQKWATDNLNSLLEDNVIIGYIFANKPIKYNIDTFILNIYAIKKSAYSGPEISTESLGKAWELFFNKYQKQERKYVTVFENPPIEQWLDTKENWCKKMATEISKGFNWTYNDALSEVYISVMTCYSKGTVYLGNLNYLRKSIYNSVLVTLRDNKHRLNEMNPNMQSLDSVICSDTDGEITLGDLIAQEQVQNEDDMEYQDLLKHAKDLLRKTFSEREIDQILNYKPSYLPMPLYRRLLAWREKHKPEELYE